MSVSLWTHMGFARVAEILARRAGLHFAPNRQPAAELAMQRVMRAARMSDPLDLARALSDRGDDELLAALLAEVTIGETYFFREPAQLDYIREQVLPSFRGARAADRPLRAWSAGCATGEEAYTLGIILREGGWADSASVVGTDISLRRLEAAQRARYTRWSLRGMSEEATDRYFIRRGSQFLLRPELRAMADFRAVNLADQSWPGGESGIGGMDLVLCRNVLIYFDRSALAEVATRLLASLSDDGWLFMGASDPMLSDIVPCETVVTGAGLAYRRGAARRHGNRSPSSGAVDAHTPGDARRSSRDPLAFEPTISVSITASVETGVAADGPASVAAPRTTPTRIMPLGGAAGDASLPPSPAPLAAAAACYARRDYTGAADAALTVVGATPRDVDAWVLLVRALANCGRTVEAEQACASALELHATSPELAYLHSLLLTQRGQFAAAAAAARRALYLDRSLAVAHLALGTALARLGHRAQAVRAFAAAERALEDFAPDAVVPLADGEVAHRLREAARTQRRLLGEEVA